MADANHEPNLDNRPGSRRGNIRPRNDSAVEVTAGPSREQQAKEKKKPRKLERRSVVLQEPVVTLDTRVERLERQFAGLSSRVDAVEVRQVRRPTAATYRRSSSTSTRATTAARARPRAKVPRHSTGDSLIPRPSLAEQLRESQRLRKTHQRRLSGEDNEIEEVPRSALLSTKEARQVALTGQYNIPHPANLSAEDILNLRSGLTAAGSIVRNLTNAWKTPSSSQDAGMLGTNLATNLEAPLRAVRSDRKERFDRADNRQGLAEDDDKENVFDVDGHGVTGNVQPEGKPVKTPRSFSSGPSSQAQSQPGNIFQRHEHHIDHEAEHEVIGAENASSSWRNFILQAGGVVASAAKDAAVEISSNPVPADGTESPIRATSGSSSIVRRREAGSPISRRLGGYAASTSSSSQRRRPKTSRTSSRASTRAA